MEKAVEKLVESSLGLPHDPFASSLPLIVAANETPECHATLVAPVRRPPFRLST